jgi:hypothetical protein
MLYRRVGSHNTTHVDQERVATRTTQLNVIVVNHGRVF